jgi:uncharacterized protein YqeY
MLIDEIRERMKAAMKARNVVEKEILRVALGEITTEEARQGSVDEATVEKILRKLVKSNQETLGSTADDTQRTTLEQEIAVLESLLPKTLTVDEIVAALAPVRDAITAAGNDGQATGVAMKHLKSQNAAVDGKSVSAAVKAIRSAG